jgi:GxxExxY protein
MATNVKLKSRELFYPELSYSIVGILYATQNQLGCFAREKQYGDEIERRLKEIGMSYTRECSVGSSGNILDFIIDNKIIVELKAKRVLLKEDFDQVQRYLQETGLKLGLLVNFRAKYLKPMRVIKMDVRLQY